LAPLRFSFSINQIGQTFNLCHVQTAIFQRSPRKLTWLSHPNAGLPATRRKNR
jgi:hypothetical protein